MKLSLAVLALIGDSNDKHHHHSHHYRGGPRPGRDIAEKNVDPWVYEKVYNAVNPQPLSRTTGPPAQDTYTPYGNAPYWPNKATPAELPVEKVPSELSAMA